MKESQSFHPFITALVVFISVFVNFMLVYLTQLSPWIVFMIMIFNAGVALAFLFSSLHTEYDEEKIVCWFFPFLYKKRIYPWKNIETAYVREYSPLREYGGWGIRFGRKKYGKAFNARGNMGVQLIFKDGKRLLIGTQKAVELEQFLNKLYSLKIVQPPLDTEVTR